MTQQPSIFAVVVEEADLHRLNMQTYKTFRESLDESNVTLVQFSRYMKDESMPDDDNMRNPITDYLKFKRVFYDKFHIDIHINYYDLDVLENKKALFGQTKKREKKHTEGQAFFSLDYGHVYQLTQSARVLQQVLPFTIEQFTDQS